MIKIILMLIFGGLFITSRAGAVGYNKENPKPKKNVEEFVEDWMDDDRGLGWETNT